MNGYAVTNHSMSHEESLSLLDEKTLSDIESESGRVDLEHRFKVPKWANAARDNIICLRSVPLSSWRTVLARVGIFFLPSFLHSRLTRQQGRTEKLIPTSYLDGMRGLAAFVVFFCHYFYQAFIIAEGYGSAPTNNHILKLPIIRLFYQGPPAVCLFFVISGYALSYKPLKLIRSSQLDGFATTMSSMTFRRIIRLYLPTMISTFMILVLLRLGVYEWTRSFANDRNYMRNVVESHPDRLETFSKQFYHWAWSMFNFVHVFGWQRYGGSTVYDVHLWTIPVEFRCSMYLFVTLLGVARLRTGVRFFVMFIIMAFTYRNSRWELLLFYFGMIIAELDLIRGAHIPHLALPVAEKTTRRSKLPGVAWALVSILSLYLMSQPDVRAAETPGWKYLTSFIPKWWTEEQYRYWQSVGAIMFVVCVSHSPNWQKFFNLPSIQYLGKISYAIYLMHGPVTHTVGYMIEQRAYALTGVQGYWYNLGFILGSLGVIPTVVWAADVFWRLFDTPTVTFARWLETKCIKQS
ncbi:acyltransferase family-domain-containing protein [Plectosphaerella cucumerina]|uniref:Acyltransferase family-domain-containing protein n=1 Tax=Plectosphaerella cucumerina TaxID=40658 RepID=A0A8K0X8R6_9PEZI|nr:acyltransferase family-domain-containing protein [Plectosphaerella cucumerina]